MKSFWLLFLCLLANINTLWGLDEALNSDSLLSLVKTKLNEYMQVHRTAHQAKEKHYKRLFADWVAIDIEDLYIDPTLARTGPKSPIDVYQHCLHIGDKSCRYTSAAFNYTAVRLFADDPEPFSVFKLKDDKIAQVFINKAFLGRKKFKDYCYIRTGIESQRFSAAKGNNPPFSRTDKMMIHWIFKKEGGFGSFAIISTHNYGNYDFQHEITNYPAWKPAAPPKFPNKRIPEVQREARTLVQNYFSACDSMPQDSLERIELFGRYFTPAAPSAVDFTGAGEKRSLVWWQCVDGAAKLPGRKRNFQIESIPDEVLRAARKTKLYYIVVKTFANTRFLVSDTIMQENAMPLNVVVLFKFENGKMYDFKISEIIYNGPISVARKAFPGAVQAGPGSALADNPAVQLHVRLKQQLWKPDYLRASINMHYDISNIEGLAEEIPPVFQGILNGKIKVNLEIYRDKFIHFELKRKVVELNIRINIHITPETIFISRNIPFFPSLAASASLEEFQQKYGLPYLNFENLQAVLMGSAIEMPDTAQIKKDQGNWEYIAPLSEQLYAAHEIDSAQLQLKNLHFNYQIPDVQARLSFYGYSKADTGEVFPEKMAFSLHSSSNNFPCKISFEKFDFGASVDAKKRRARVNERFKNIHTIKWDDFFEQFMER